MKRVLLLLIAFLLTNVIAFAQPTAGLVAYWPMDGNFNDLGPYTINGTNTAATVTTNRDGLPNTAMSFDNPGGSVPVYQYGTLPINSNLNFSGTQDFTISFWAFFNTTPLHAGGLYDNNLNTYGPGVWWWTGFGYPSIQFNYKGSSVGTPNGALTLGVWQQITCVRESGTLKVYINGVLKASGTESGSTPTYPLAAGLGTMMYSGYSPPVYNGHNGKLDEMRVYNRALSEAEINILVVLPIKLNFFTADFKNNNVALQWQTALEQNCSQFILQRSTDGVNFINVGNVAATGSTSEPKNYSYVDVLPVSVQNQKKLFYRLQSVDRDGKFAGSNIIPVNLSQKETELLVYPNPVKEILQVQLSNMQAGKSTLIITDASGRQVFQKDMELPKGTNTIPINVAGLASGTYMVKLETSLENFVKQFIKD